MYTLHLSLSLYIYIYIYIHTYILMFDIFVDGRTALMRSSSSLPRRSLNSQGRGLSPL